MAKRNDDAKAATDQMMSLFEEWQNAGLAAWAWTNPSLLQQMSEINSEVVQFVSDRIRQDVQFQQELMKCRDPAEFRELQGQFLKDAFDQYSAETGKLVQMNQAALKAMTDRNTKS